MKKCIVLLSLLLSILTIQAQSSDEKIANLLNQNDFFSLKEQYPELKEKCETKMLRLMSETLIASHFNRPEEANTLIDSLLSKHQEEMGFNNIFSFVILKSNQLYALGDYNESSALLSNFITQIAPHIDSTTISNLNLLIRQRQALNTVGKRTMIRPSSDCSVPFYTHEVNKNGRIATIPVNINNVEEHFVLDSGCPNGGFVSKSFAKKHKIKPILDSVLITGTGSDYGELGIIDSLSVGSIKFYNLLVHIAPSDISPDSVFNIDAILGIDFLKLLGEIQIYPKEQKIFFPFKKSKIVQGDQNLIFFDDQLYVKTSSNNDRLTFNLDLGNAETFLDYSYYVKHVDSIDENARKENVLSGGFGKIEYIDIYRLPVFGIIIGDKNFEIKNLKVLTKPAFKNQKVFDGSIGFDFLSRSNKIILNLDDMYMFVD